MARRFIDSELFRKRFVRSLKAPYKLLWVYMFCECDLAGIWDVDLEAAELYCGAKFSIVDFAKNFEGKVHLFSDDTKAFVPDFIEFQYPKGLQESNPAHKNIFLQLSKYQLFEVLKNGASKPLNRPFEGSKYKYKDKDKDNKGGVGGKKKYSEFVLMTESEYSKLASEFGESGAARMIEMLNNYKGSRGKQYKSDYLAIRNWVVQKYLNEGDKSAPAQSRPTLAKLHTYDQFCDLVSRGANPDDYECVEVGGRKMWRQKG